METDKRFTICRLCLCSSEVLFNIFEYYDVYTPADVITELLQLEVYDRDVYPQCVCGGCMEKLKDFKKFKEMCEVCKLSLDCAYAVKCTLVPDINPQQKYHFVKKKLAATQEETLSPKMLRMQPIPKSNSASSNCCVSSSPELVKEEGIIPDDATACLEAIGLGDVDVSDFKEELITPDAPITNIITPERYDVPEISDVTVTTFDISSSFQNDATEGGQITESMASNAPSLSDSDLKESNIECPGSEYSSENKSKDSNVFQSELLEKTNSGYEKGIKAFQCSLCGKRYGRKRHLQEHIEAHEFGRRFKCNTCGKCYISKKNLTEHLKVHVADRNHVCDVCGKAFKASQNLKVHKLRHGDKNYTCELCGKRFFTSTSLTDHVKYHNKEKIYPCDICGKLFSHRVTLKKHIEIHSGRRDWKYSCNECGKKCVSPSMLKKHQMTHTGERPFLCSFCGNCYSTNASLNIHMNTHTRDKSYKCEICEAELSSLNALSRHRDRHTGEKKYKCDECGKEYTQSHNLRNHRKKQHQE